jgi:hypothetical protein
MVEKKKQRAKEETTQAVERAISDIRAQVAILPDLRGRLELLESRIELSESRRGRGTPVAFQPVFFQLVPTGDPPMHAVTPPPEITCFEDIQTSAEGRLEYDVDIKKGTSCGDPTETQKAQAAIMARKNLLDFGMVWCIEGKGKCASGKECEPRLSGIRITSYEKGEVLVGEVKKCFVVAKMSGTISCKCKSG